MLMYPNDNNALSPQSSLFYQLTGAGIPLGRQQGKNCLKI